MHLYKPLIYLAARPTEKAAVLTNQDGGFDDNNNNNNNILWHINPYKINS